MKYIDRIKTTRAEQVAAKMMTKGYKLSEIVPHLARKGLVKITKSDLEDAPNAIFPSPPLDKNQT